MILLLAGLLLGNYHVDLGEDQIESLPEGPFRIFIFFVYYAVAYFSTILAYHFLVEKVKSTPSAFGYLLVMLLLASVHSDFYFHRVYLVPAVAPELQYFMLKCSGNGSKALLVFCTAFMLFLNKKSRTEGFFGLLYTKYHLKPYWIMLLIMLPLIGAASFQEDFQNFYPRYTSTEASVFLKLPFWVTQLVFQTFYGLDFVAVELLYRGLLCVLAFQLIGPSAIWGMVVVYCMIHFGKPEGEAISSIFGGLILGIIAFRSKSIQGGVIVHLGVAWLMELAAFFQMMR